MADLRALADQVEASRDCVHPACRRRGRCRGPGGTTAAVPGKVLPACLADTFEELHRPVRRWQALWDTVARAEALLAERACEHARPTAGGGAAQPGVPRP